MHAYGFGLGFLNFLGTALFVLALIFAVKVLARGGWQGGRRGWARCQGRWDGHGPQAPDEAMRAARERLARGEIDPEAFEALRKGLAPAEARQDGRPDGALELARLRFAQGELTPEEFEAIKKALQA